MPSSTTAVASSPVAPHFAMLPAPTRVTGPDAAATLVADRIVGSVGAAGPRSSRQVVTTTRTAPRTRDRKSTRLNSSHSQISYAVFCLKKKKNTTHKRHHLE